LGTSLLSEKGGSAEAEGSVYPPRKNALIDGSNRGFAYQTRTISPGENREGCIKRKLSSQLRDRGIK